MQRSLCTLLALAGAAHAQTASVLVWYRTPYPTLPAGTTLFPISGIEQTIAPNGPVAFTATLSTGGQVVCRVTPAGPVILAHTGDPAPGIPGSTLTTLGGAFALPDGGVVFSAGLSTTGSAVYLDRGSGPEVCLKYGDPVPGHSGLIVTSFGSLSYGGGTLAMQVNTGTIGTANTGSSHWFGTPGAMSLIAHTGDATPGDPGRTFATFTSSASINSAGQTTFEATTTPSGSGLWTGSPLVPGLQRGDPCPGLPGCAFYSIYDPVVNSAGDMVFTARIDNGTTLDYSLWLRSGETTALLARQTEPAPGTSAFFNLFGPAFPPTSTILTDDGLVVFTASLTGPGVFGANSTGIWAGTPGHLHLVARGGGPAPGFSATIQRLGYNNSQLIFSADRRGHIVYTATLSTQAIVVYSSDFQGHSEPVLASGRTVQLGAGAPDTVVSFGLPYTSYSGPSGRPVSLTDDGHLLLYLRTNTNPVTTQRDSLALLTLPTPCYVNCDYSTAPPVLNVLDFTCFLNRFAAGDSYANCDDSTTAPVLNVLDFTCFLNKFAAGCS